jgi:ADP-heptose:LPS heptosyltransferase
VATFAALGARLIQAGVVPVILGAGAEDAAFAGEIRVLAPGAVDLTNRGGLALSAAWIAGARALVGVDSGLAHLSAGCGIPTLAVYGPTRPRHSAPWGPRVKVVRREDVPCLECMTSHCPVQGHPCMEGLSGERLWDDLMSLLGTERQEG